MSFFSVNIWLSRLRSTSQTFYIMPFLMCTLNRCSIPGLSIYRQGSISILLSLHCRLCLCTKYDHTSSKYCLISFSGSWPGLSSDSLGCGGMARMSHISGYASPVYPGQRKGSSSIRAFLAFFSPFSVIFFKDCCSSNTYSS